MSTLPVIRPVIVKRKKVPFDGLEWIFELKFNGHRAVLYYENGVCRLHSKTNARHLFPKLETDLAQALSQNKSVILDGEIVSFDDKGGQSLERLHRREGNIAFVAFDILWLDGKDLRNLPLERRKVLLRRVVQKNLALCDGCIGEGVSYYTAICNRDLEGVIAKERTGTYGKSAKWFKIINPNYSGIAERNRIFRAARRKK